MCTATTDIIVVVMYQGGHLLRGSRLVDFDIRLGDAECVPVTLTDSQVSCQPPISRPDTDINDTICHDDTLSLNVCIRHVYHEAVS